MKKATVQASKVFFAAQFNVACWTKCKRGLLTLCPNTVHYVIIIIIGTLDIFKGTVTAAQLPNCHALASLACSALVKRGPTGHKELLAFILFLPPLKDCLCLSLNNHRCSLHVSFVQLLTGNTKENRHLFSLIWIGMQRLPQAHVVLFVPHAIKEKCHLITCKGDSS